MAKRGQPPHSNAKRSILAAIARLTFKSQGPGKVDSNVQATAEEFKKQRKQNPRWRGLPGSARSIYALLKESRKARKLKLLQRHKWRLK